MKRPFQFSSPGFNSTLDKVQTDLHIESGTSDDFQRFWYCPRDRTELKIVPNQISAKIERRDVDKTIMDGIASKRFSSDLYYAVKILAEHVFTTSSLQEISICLTSCPKCHMQLCSPKLK